MKKQTQIIFFVLLLVSLLLPSNTVLSQDGDDDETDYWITIPFYWGINLAASLDGKEDVDALRSIRDSYQRGFDDMITKYENNQRYQAADIGKVLRGGFMRLLDKRVKLAEERARQASDKSSGLTAILFSVVSVAVDSENENTPPESNPAVANFLPILQKQTKQNATDLLYGHIASRIPSSGAAIASSSPSQIYHVDAGLPSSSAPPVVSQDNAENNGNSGSGDINIQKPLQFANNGLYDATVLVFSYTPAEGVTAGMSSASTVVFRGSNPSANLSLPIGSYVFCYYWDLGTDANNDGYVDYAHKNTGNVTLTAQSTDNMNSAQVVSLNPGSMNNPNGKCGETAPPSSENSDNLTPQELANQGTHTYAMNCVCNGASELECDFWGGDWDPFGATIDFVEGGVNLTDEEGVTYFQAKLGLNTYDYADNMANGKLTFTDVGMIYSGEGLICTAIRR